ncbi:selenocysteine insertion sequence-binding protein 2-like [Actinia tenebrosa]|uniref:Selenocysteine insertion sequence-binding protein 2-like n=1 Tax=Actinia tenebrosa TaxID=6105 RepID=A0A6P8JC02_ACTTE|nr:selenocysteine insertion sequence-binding protein 2-like [Actinia tenebrosa]
MKRIILKEREEKRKASEGEGNQDEISESQSLAEEHHSSEETGDGHKSEGKSSSEDNDLTVLQSKDDVKTHHHGNADDTAADLSSNIDQTVAPSEDDVKAQIHSRRFREYCDNVMDKELNNTTLQLLQKLVMFQDRQYHKDPVKSKAKRRFVVGLREVTKHLKLKKIKLVIISPNVERIKSAGGLDDTLHNIISIAHQNGVPVVFTQPSRNLPNEKYSSTTPDKQDHDENEGPSKKKKKKKKKKTKDYDGNTKQVPQEAKKTKQPMQFDLGDWLSTIEMFTVRLLLPRPTKQVFHKLCDQYRIL